MVGNSTKKIFNTQCKAVAIFLCPVVFIAFFLPASAQRCDTYNYLLKHPVQNTASQINQKNSSVTRDTLANEVIIIPVVIHVLYNKATENISDAQVLSQLQVLNNDYRRLNADAVNTPSAFAGVAADARIVFCLAKIDPYGKSTSGIIRKFTSVQSWTADDRMKFSAQGGDDAWTSKRYLNIWVCNLFGRSLGYSSLPGSEADKDGVVIQSDAFGTTGTVVAPYNKGRTATHEIGHWLGLKHLWGDAVCGDDGIADTPPQQTYTTGCPSFPHLSSCSINSYGDMFMNFMDFTDDACMNMFTQDQKKEMRSLFAAGGYRNSFLNSTVCDSNSVQRAPLPVDSTSGAKMSVSLYPNPATNFINIEIKNQYDIVGKTVKVYNALGTEVMTFILSSPKQKISIEQLPKGFYILKFDGGTEIKFVRH